MADLEFFCEMAAPPNEVFAFFSPQRMPYWYGAEMDAQFEMQGGASEFGVGQKVRITGTLGSREVSLTVVVTRYEWGRLLEWQFQDSYGVRGLQSWLLEPAGPGTRIVMRDRYELPGRVGKWWDKMLTRRAVARRDREWLARLKRLMERASTAPAAPHRSSDPRAHGLSRSESRADPKGF